MADNLKQIQEMLQETRELSDSLIRQYKDTVAQLQKENAELETKYAADKVLCAEASLLEAALNVTVAWNEEQRDDDEIEDRLREPMDYLKRALNRYREVRGLPRAHLTEFQLRRKP